ncbi:MAG: SDR family oxidoreductase [Candidatus Nanopelagicales bacterium]
MSTLLMTGFPGFLGSALLPRLLARRDGVHALCLVQGKHMDTARERLAELEAANPDILGRVELVEGDITEVGLGLSDATAPRDVSEVWHLAAIYDLTVPEAIARKVNIGGTANVLAFCAGQPDLQRLHYVSTCYVSGKFTGEFGEDVLEEGQSFNNHYETTKYEAEVLVRAAIAGGLPATIYRPGIVVGDSATGETQKFDGPYFVAEYIKRLPGAVFLPDVDPEVKASLVPRDFLISAMDELSVLDRSVGRTYQLTDPNPPSAREVAEIFAGLLNRKPVFLPVKPSVLRALLVTLPGMEQLTGLPAELLDYFGFATTYSTANTTADLAGTGLACPAFKDYAGVLLEFMHAHPEISSEAMV